MTFEWDVFGPPLFALAGGLAAGALLATRMSASREEAESVLRDGRVDDLAGTREDAVSSLRALEQERGKLELSEYARQRRELLSRGAEALRELDEGVVVELPESDKADRVAALEAQRETLGDAAVDAAIAALRGEQQPESTGSSAITGAAWTLVLIAMAAVLWLQLSGDAAPRGEMGSMTGNAGPAPEAPVAPPPRPEHPQKAAWQAALDKDPKDLEALNGLTEAAIGERDLGLAMELSGKALEVAPDDPDARTHRAVLQATVGMSHLAFEQLEAVRKDHPEFAKAWVYTGLLALDQGKPELASEALTRAIELQPDRAAFLAPRLEEAQRALSGGGAQTLISGRVEAPGITIAGTETLFVSLRDPAGGPPLAALRLPPQLPADIVVTSDNLIAMGGAPRPVPAQVVVTVRLDRDGNPMTKDGPSSAPVTVDAGTADLAFTLSE